MKIKEKLIWSYTGIALLVVIVSVFSFKLSSQIWGLRTIELPMEQHLREVEVGVWTTNHAANSFKLSGNVFYKNLYYTHVQEVEENLAKYSSLVDTNDEIQLLKEFQDNWQTSKIAAERMILLAEQQKTAEDTLFINVDEADDVLDFEIQANWTHDDPHLMEKEKAVREVEVSIWEAIHAAQQFTGLSGTIVRGEQKHVGHAREAAKRGANASLVKGDFADLMERQFKDVEEYWTIYKGLPRTDAEKRATKEFDIFWERAVKAGREVVRLHDETEIQFNELYAAIKKTDDIIDNKMQAFIETRIKDEDLKAKRINRDVLAVCIIAFIFSVVIGTFTARSICRPISKLNFCVNQIKNGNMDISINSRKKDEFGRLMSSFLEMADQLKTTIDDLKHEIIRRKEKEQQLHETQSTLVRASHQAGMSEVATDVLHNVGNVLSSINVATTLINERVEQSEISNIEKVSEMIQEHMEDLGAFFTEDPKGKHVPSYLTKALGIICKEREDVIEKLKDLTHDVSHVKSIIQMQQEYTKTVKVEILTTIEAVIEDAIRINWAGLERHEIQLVRDFEDIGEIYIDKQRVIQILVNLIGNAKYALDKNDTSNRIMTLRSYKNDDKLRIEVQDNGIGISKENLVKIFQHGFTTKKHGHGFGLHSGALAAKELNGTLTADSDGEGCGSTFALEIPLNLAVEPTTEA